MKLKTKLSKLRHDGHITDAEYAIIINVLNKFSTQPPKAQPCEDCISRAAIYEALSEWDEQDVYLPYHFKELVAELPSVTPKPSEDCRNCKKWNECLCGKEGHENGTSIGYSIGECKEYETCEDCVSRQDAVDIINGYAEQFNGYIGTPNDTEVYAYARGLLLGIESNISALPSVKPKGETITEFADRCQECGKMRKGHWILGVCDECEYDWGKDAPIASVPNFCPNCGCRMIKPQESESDD